MKTSSEGKSRGLRRSAASLLALLLIAAACGGSDDAADTGTEADSGTETDASTDAESGASEGGVSAEKLAELEALVAAGEAVPVFEPQGDAFSVAELADMKIFAMPVASSLTGCDNMARWTVEIAKSIGMTESFYFQNDGGPAAWQEGMEQAINGGYDGVALVCGIDPNALTPQMEAAREAGIQVVDMHLSDVSVAADPLIAGQTNGEFNRAMELGVYAALIRSGGEPIDVFMMTSNENPPSVGMEQAVKDTLAELCSACTFDSSNVSIPDFFGGAGQSTIDAALIAHPDLDAVFLAYDFMAPVIEGSIAANSSDALVYAFGGDSAVVPTMLSEDSAVGSTMGPDFLWMAYTGADQLFRALAGEPVIPANEAVAPYRMWTPNNAAEKTEEAGAGFGGEFMQGYYDLWLDNPATETYTP